MWVSASKLSFLGEERHRRPLGTPCSIFPLTSYHPKYSLPLLEHFWANAIFLGHCTITQLQVNSPAQKIKLWFLFWQYLSKEVGAAAKGFDNRGQSWPSDHLLWRYNSQDEKLVLVNYQRFTALITRLLPLYSLVVRCNRLGRRKKTLAQASTLALAICTASINTNTNTSTASLATAEMSQTRRGCELSVLRFSSS